MSQIYRLASILCNVNLVCLLIYPHSTCININNLYSPTDHEITIPLIRNFICLFVFSNNFLNLYEKYNQSTWGKAKGLCHTNN